MKDLKAEVEKASWDMLKEHYERGAVFVIQPELEITEVGNAMAKDFTAIVKIWLDDNKMRRLTPEELSLLEEHQKEEMVRFLIIRPYVIIQFL